MKTGVIGLGAMGMPMAMNLHKAGHLHGIWNRTRSKAENLANETGCHLADSAGQLASVCEMIIICVSRDNDVLDMINTITQNITPGTIVADTSTVSADTARQAAILLNEKGAHFLDCPVSGGVEGAKKGTLAMMIGGEESILDRARTTLSAIATNIVYMGPTGSGQSTKAVNQHMAAGINQAVTEALAFGESLGLDMDKVVDVISSGACSNWFLQHRGKTMLADSFDPGFKLSLHHKDLEIVKRMGEINTGVNMPMVEMTLIHYQRLMDEGFGDEDISALFRLKRQQQQDDQ
jgi:3-hydroxyisobutyrate dehydrogenase